MKNLSFVCFFLTFSLLCSAQEICNNGVDDDGDGLIDLQDNECECTNNYIYNGLLEGPCTGQPLASVPDGFEVVSQTDTHSSACEDWSGPFVPPAPPVGEMVYMEKSFANVGSFGQCLSQPLLAGESYTLSFDYYGRDGGPYTLDESYLQVMGIGSCTSLDWFGSCWSGFTPPADSELYLGPTVPDIDGQWATFSITITPSFETNYIYFMLPCVSGSGSNGYGIFLANLQITDVSPVVLPDIELTGSVCNGITASVDNTAAPNATFQWYLDGVAINGATSADYTLPPNGSGELSVTAFTPGCQRLEAVVEPPEFPEVEENIVNNLCSGQTGGSIELEPMNSNDSYTYNWENGANGNSLENLSAGVYSVTVTDDDGCSSEFTYEVTEPSLLAGQIISQDIDPLTDQGTATASANGGVMPYTFLWSNGETSELATELPPLESTVTITDAQGCTEVLSVFIPPLPFEVFVTTGPSCINQCSGDVIFEIRGGVPPYSGNFNNEPIVDSELIENICIGDYTFEISDSYGNFNQGDIYIPIFDTLEYSIIIDSLACDSDELGSITVELENNNLLSSIEWSTGADTLHIGQLPAGEYSVSLTDNNNCITERDISILPVASFQVSKVFDNPTCAYTEDGKIEVTIPGDDTTSYNIRWQDGSDNFTKNNLAAGTYAFSLNNDDDCTITDSIVLVSPQEITYDLSLEDTICQGLDNGSIALLIDTSSIESILWEGNTSNLLVRNNLGPGRYNLQIIDTIGCMVYDTIEIVELDTIALSAVIQYPKCGEDNGNINVNIASPWSNILWSNGATDIDSIANLSSGEYWVDVISPNGCTSNYSVELTTSDFPAYSLHFDDSICEGQMASASIVSDHIDLLDITWSSGSNSEGMSGLLGGDYYVSLTDSSLCTVIDSFRIVQYDTIPLSIQYTNPDCNLSNGSISLTNTETWQQISWSNGSSGVQTIDNLSVGTYSVTVSSDQGCQSMANLSLIDEGFPVYSIEYDETLCAGAMTSVQVLVAAGEELSVTWPDGFEGMIRDNVEAGEYSIQLEDISGCQIVERISIDEYLEPNITWDIRQPSCDILNGSISIAEEVNLYTFQWTHGPTSSNLSDLPPGNFEVIVVDSASCNKSYSFTIDDFSRYIPQVESVDPLCHGSDNGILLETTDNYIQQVSVNGVEYSLGDQVLTAGTSEVQYLSIDGCTYDTLLIITEPDPLQITLDSTSIVDIENGSISIMITGGVAPYTVSWDDGDDNLIRSGLEPGIYNITATDSKGCLVSNFFVIPEDTSPLSVTVEVQDESCELACDGRINWTLDGGVAPFRYYFEGENVSSPMQENLCAGSYQLIVLDATDQADSIWIEIEESDSMPIVEWTQEGPGQLTEDGTIKSSLEVSGAKATLEWYVDDVLMASKSSNESMDFQYVVADKNKDYMVKVIATSAAGCTDSAEKLYLRADLENEPQFPNIISISSINNNRWLPMIPNTMTHISTHVYDRWGNPVYTTQNLENGWDGSWNGRPVINGVYVYKVILAVGGEEEIYVGDITVVD